MFSTGGEEQGQSKVYGLCHVCSVIVFVIVIRREKTFFSTLDVSSPNLWNAGRNAPAVEHHMQRGCGLTPFKTVTSARL